MATGLIQACMYYLAFSFEVPHGFTLALSLRLSPLFLYIFLSLSVWMCCLWAIIRVDRLVGGSL